MNNTKNLGNWGEQKAAQYLISQGFLILETNYHTRYGEIDIIAKDDNNEFVFVEVKTRKNNFFGTALESITEQKMRKIQRTVQKYLQEKKLEDVLYRIDAIAIEKNQEGKWAIEYVRNILE